MRTFNNADTLANLQCYSQVCSKFMDHGFDAHYRHVCNQVSNPVRDLVRGHVGRQVLWQLRDQIRDQYGISLGIRPII